MDNKKSEVEKLRWVRVFSPIHIPKYLVEQIRDREFTIEDFYKYQELNCLVETEKGPTLNPFNHLYVTVDDENIVKGFFWFIIDPLCKEIFINTFSMDKEYWGGGHAMEKASDHIKMIMKKLKIKKASWITNYPKHSQKHGFKRSKGVIMEYKEEEDGGFRETVGRGTEERKGHQHVVAGAAAVI